MLENCLKFWVVTLLAFSFVIAMNGTPEGNLIFSCWCFMLKYETFGIVYAIYISAFLSVSLSEQSFLFTESPIYRIICSRRTVLYVFIQQPRLAIAMFLPTKWQSPALTSKLSHGTHSPLGFLEAFKMLPSISWKQRYLELGSKRTRDQMVTPWQLLRNFQETSRKKV